MMDAAILLDVLGNENRRRILQLLSWKPCFVSEISDRLNVGPKAVISHLEMLETTGLIESYVDEHRRKYYHISDNIRIEISLSPFSYGVEATSITVRETPRVQATRLVDLYDELRGLENAQRELAEAQRRTQASYTEVFGACIDAIEDVARNHLEAEILLTLLRRPQPAHEVSMRLMIPITAVVEALMDQRARGTVEEKRGVWMIKRSGDQS